jgi:hypothetical protein
MGFIYLFHGSNLGRAAASFGDKLQPHSTGFNRVDTYRNVVMNCRSYWNNLTPLSPMSFVAPVILCLFSTPANANGADFKPSGSSTRLSSMTTHFSTRTVSSRRHMHAPYISFSIAVPSLKLFMILALMPFTLTSLRKSNQADTIFRILSVQCVVIIRGPAA